MNPIIEFRYCLSIAAMKDNSLNIQYHIEYEKKSYYYVRMCVAARMRGLKVSLRKAFMDDLDKEV